MRAMVFHDGEPGAGRLALEEYPDPVPAAGEVLVRVTVCGVCRTDLDVVDGRLAPAHLPIVPGHQVVGRSSHRSEPGSPACAQGSALGWRGSRRPAAHAAGALRAKRTSVPTSSPPAAAATAGTPSCLPCERPSRIQSPTRSPTSTPRHCSAPARSAGVLCVSPTSAMATRSGSPVSARPRICSSARAPAVSAVAGLRLRAEAGGAPLRARAGRGVGRREPRATPSAPAAIIDTTPAWSPSWTRSSTSREAAVS